MKPPERGALALGDQAQEPGLCPQQWRGDLKHPSTDAPLRPGAALGQGTPRGKVPALPEGAHPEPLPASAAPKLGVTRVLTKQPIDS